MTLSRLQKFGVAASLALATTFGIASQAQALEPGCQNADVVRTQLREEGQFVLVTGRRNSAGTPKNIFTSNENGTLGYNIEEGDRSARGQLCVATRYTDIRVNTNPNLTRPNWASFGSNSEHDRWLSTQETRDNMKVLLGATTLVRRPDGTDIRGPFLMVASANDVSGMRSATDPTIFGFLTVNSGVALVTSSQGRSTSLFALMNVDRVEPNYNAFAHRPQQLALNNR